MRRSRKKKKTRGWAIAYPDKHVDWHWIRKYRQWSKEDFMNEYGFSKWKTAYDLGYRCVRVTIEEQ